MIFMIRAILHMTDNIPENYVQNQFCVDSGSAPPDTAPLTAAIEQFYEDLRVNVLSAAVATSGHEVKYYELPGTSPNYPFWEDTFALTQAPGGSTLPQEVAICSSFQGTRAAGDPQARRRGRVFISPISVAANGTGRPGPTARNDLRDATRDLGFAINAVADHTWCVWSSVDQEAVPVQNGWIDNAFDTQRRRGVQATERTTWAYSV